MLEVWQGIKDNPVLRFCKLYAFIQLLTIANPTNLLTNRLPDAAEFILTSSIDNSFVCSDEGIYADVNNSKYLAKPFDSTLLSQQCCSKPKC